MISFYYDYLYNNKMQHRCIEQALSSEKISKITRMAYLSSNAYKYADINNLPPKAIKRYKRILVYTKPEDKHHIIVVRGSMLLKRPKDLIMNINMKNVLYNEYRFHKGFFDEAVKIKKELTDKGVLEDGYTIDFTGHSSGGCIACILAMLTYESTNQVNEVITFGQPKFIKDVYGCPLNFTRVVNIADPIPILPIWDYKHIGQTIILDVYNQGNLPKLSAHDMKSYINNLVLDFMRPI